MSLKGMPRRLRACVVAALALAPLAGRAEAAPRAELWPRWQAHVPGSTRSADHAAWNRLLVRYLRRGRDGIARLAYAAVTAEDRAALAAYVVTLEETPVGQLDRPEQRAFWINLYNAATVRVILEHWPVASIRDIAISPGLFTRGPWGKKLVSVEGEPLSLDDIEHRILRPIWRDPRIHYALNCASLGCPDLAGRAYTGAAGEAMLEAAARRYVNHPRGARVEGGRLVVSSIYAWFQEDFGGSEAGVIAHLRGYADPPLSAALEGVRRVADHAYDWSINVADELSRAAGPSP